MKPRIRLTGVFPVDLSLLTLSICACPPESILPPPYFNGVCVVQPGRDGFFIKTDPTRTIGFMPELKSRSLIPSVPRLWTPHCGVNC